MALNIPKRPRESQPGQATDCQKQRHGHQVGQPAGFRSGSSKKMRGRGERMKGKFDVKIRALLDPFQMARPHCEIQSLLQQRGGNVSVLCNSEAAAFGNQANIIGTGIVAGEGYCQLSRRIFAIDPVSRVRSGPGGDRPSPQFDRRISEAHRAAEYLRLLLCRQFGNNGIDQKNDYEQVEFPHGRRLQENYA